MTDGGEGRCFECWIWRRRICHVKLSDPQTFISHGLHSCNFGCTPRFPKHHIRHPQGGRLSAAWQKARLKVCCPKCNSRAVDDASMKSTGGGGTLLVRCTRRSCRDSLEDLDLRANLHHLVFAKPLTLGPPPVSSMPLRSVELTLGSPAGSPYDTPLHLAYPKHGTQKRESCCLASTCSCCTRCAHI